jgi:4-diphosphocytidyl-2-C-methyl-D-erythritol kinase
MSDIVRLRANAKLNLFLRVVGVDKQGWHELETVFHSVALADLVELAHAPRGEIRVDMTAEPEGRRHLPAREDNLVSIAAARMAQMAPEPAGASIAVAKNIPIGAGLAGGSADAAATIVGLNALWKLDLPGESVLELAAALGSDIAFCLGGGTALGTGRGNDLVLLPEPRPMWFVLGISDRPMLTGDVYEAWDQQGDSGAVSSGGMIQALGRGDLADVALHLRNDLLVPAVTLRPEIKDGLAALLDAGALGAGMSGSGPTVFGMAAGPAEAEALGRKVAGRFARVEVVHSAPTGVEWL